MLFSTRIAAIFFGIALLGWGIIHFVIGDFAAGRAPAWPEGVPGKIAWAYVSGVTLIVAAISIFTKPAFTKRYGAQVLITCTGAMILLWAGVRNLVVLFTTLDYGGQLTNTGKSLTMGFGALLIASLYNNHNYKHIIEKCAAIFTGLFFVGSGIQHFIFIQFVKTLVPSWIPGAAFWSYLAGVALIASGIALITGIQRKLAAFLASWMVFIWFVILHVPRGFGATGNTNEWIAIFEALAVSAILAIIYHTSNRSS